MRELAKRNKSNVTAIDQGQQYSKLMELAITGNADVDKLEKLMDLQERWEAKQAKRAFTDAMSEFQKICPPVLKGKSGHNCKYATLPSIHAVIKNPLYDCGLSFRYEQSVVNSEMTVKCVVTHIEGHSESTAMSAPMDASGSKNAIQAIGSSNSYLQRYTLIGALGIVTADYDDDGMKANEINIRDLLDLYKLVRDKFDVVSGIKEALANEDFDLAGGYWQDLSKPEKQMLWRAPTKGGIFTTEERNIMGDTQGKYFRTPVSAEEVESQSNNSIQQRE